jgi:hypothetical protein
MTQQKALKTNRALGGFARIAFKASYPSIHAEMTF